MAVTQQALGFASGTNVFVDTANANAAITVKGSSATLCYLQIDNSANGAASYTKLFNSAGTVTVGTTVPDMVVMAPASTIITIPIPAAIVFGTGLQVCTTTAGGTVGSTSPSSSVIVRIVYA